MAETDQTAWPRKGEDHLLAPYWKRTKLGTLYTEVGIGGSTGVWPGSAQRRIDGVIARGGPHEVRSKSEFSRDVKGSREWTSVDLIEVKRGLNEGVVGQALAAKWMFEQQYGATHGISVGDNVVLYSHEDPAMKWVASKLGLKPVREGKPRKNNPLRSRTRYRLRDGDIARLVAYRKHAPGRVITRVPIGGRDSGVEAWSGGKTTYVKYVRVVGANADVVAVLESKEELKKIAQSHKLEVLIVQPKLNRGGIGVAKCHALFLQEQYGCSSVSSVIVCGRSDAALAAVCAAEHIQVGVRVVETDGAGDQEAEEEEE